MATYPVVHKETGEQKEVRLSIHEWAKWCEDNSDWKRDWSDPSTMPGVGEVGDMRFKGEANSSGWNEVLDRASKQPGATVRKNRDYS